MHQQMVPVGHGITESPEAVSEQREQVGALCVRWTARGPRVLLVTTRTSGRWIIPKGWPAKKLLDCAAAAREAYEEAGVSGDIGRKPIGRFSYFRYEGKQRLELRVSVYLLSVQDEYAEWPERRQRTRLWCSVEGAARRVSEPDLRALIHSVALLHRHDGQYSTSVA